MRPRRFGLERTWITFTALDVDVEQLLDGLPDLQSCARVRVDAERASGGLASICS